MENVQLGGRLVFKIIMIYLLSTCRAENLPFLDDSTTFSAVVDSLFFLFSHKKIYLNSSSRNV